MIGIPKNTLLTAQTLAESIGEKGWLLTLNMPSYLSIISHSNNHELRQEMYCAYNTRASDQGPNAGKWDNSEIMNEILTLRYELAKLLGFNNFAEKTLVNKMAKSPKHVLSFLTNLAKQTYLQGKKEFIELTKFAKNHYGINKLEPWDLNYYSEKQKQHKFSINNEQIRAYFPEQQVINGMFIVVDRIYGLKIKECYDVEIWHPDVRFFELYDKCGYLYGSFYLDLYSRKHKYSGAWMSECISKLKYADGTEQKPVAYLICNFNKPIKDKPALFSHDEIITLFHEFGHVLHHILTKIEIPSVAGTNGVPWDSIELPSQLMENWCWEPETLAIISGHYKTGNPLPKSILNNILATKNYHIAMSILRQIELSLFDYYLHTEYNPKKNGQILSILKSIKQQFAVTSFPEWNRFPNTFSHIFSGNYAACYYSYLWSDVLAADVYEKFSSDGIFNRDTGLSFLNNILSLGGSEEPIILFERFRGRKPKIDAMLKNYGIKTKTNNNYLNY